MRSARLLAALAGAALATGAHAQTAEWINPDGGDWLDGANWAAGLAPTAADLARFDLASDYPVFLPESASARELEILRGVVSLLTGAGAPSSTLTIAGAEGVDRALRIDGGSLVTDATIDAPSLAIGGGGMLTLRDGGAARVGHLHLATEAGSSGEVRIEGPGSRLEVDLLNRVNGDATISVGLGGALAVRNDDTFRFRADGVGSLRIEFDGGAVEDAQVFEAVPNGAAASCEVIVRNGAALALGERLETSRLRLEGDGTTARMQNLRVTDGLTIRDGASLHLAPDDFVLIYAASGAGGFTIDGAEFIVDDGVDAPAERMFLAGFDSSGSTDRRIAILNGARVDVEGALVLSFRADSEIRGGGTVVRQRQHLAGAGLALPAMRGYTRIVGLASASGAARAAIDIGYGARVECSFMEIGATLRLGDGAIVAERSVQLLDGEMTVSDASTLVAGTLALGERLAAGSPPIARTNTYLRGRGLISADVANGAVIDPGVDVVPATLRIEGTLTQRLHTRLIDNPSYPDLVPFKYGPGILHIDIASPIDHDRLEVTGDAILGGTLEIALVDGFAPAWGDAFSVLTAGAIDGEFETLDLPEAPAGLVYEVEYTDAAATLTLARRTDITRDLVVGAEDLSALLTHWGTADDRADVNADGVVDGADLGIVLGDWGARAN